MHVYPGTDKRKLELSPEFITVTPFQLQKHVSVCKTFHEDK